MNKIDLNGQVAVITGGARGLGFGTASRLLGSGAKVAIWDRDIDAIKAAQELLGKEHKATDVAGVQVDVTDYASVEAALAKTESTIGPVSILVNSAGIAGASAEVTEFPLDAWDEVISINLTGTFYVNRALVPGMKARNYGRIVNIASIAGKEGNPTASGYSASKAGVIGLTKSLGKELAGYDIAVNAITPAVANTPILDKVPQEFIDFMLSKVPRARFLEVEELASMVCWLVSAENSFTTAAVFDLSGGRATY
ncbi:MAG: SDR family oxidoreductase [Alphaproteobacteria bacterium]|nr:SDR family oxidoreductase [Alphaproteobacteria bacterium]